MRRGTRVGAAYVAVTADGSGINEEIVDSVDAAGDDIDSKGKEHGDKYGEGFSEGFLTRVKGRIGDRLSKSLSGKDVAGRAGDDAGESFVDRMSDKVKDMGDRIGAELSDRLASNPEQVRRGIDRAFDDDFVDRIGNRLGDRLASGMAESIDRQSAVITDAVDRVLEKAVSGNGRRIRKDNSGLGDVIGRMLGAGSRNNALNLFGKSIGNITNLIAKVTFGAVGMFSVFSKGFASAAEGASLFTRIGAGSSAVGARMSAAFAGLLASLPTVLIGLAAVTIAMTILVSIASALLAIVVALASTIASALVGALAVGTGAFLALGAAIGLTTLAFTSMTNAQSKALKSAFQPLKAEATGLGQIMLRQMVPAFEIWSKNLQIALLLIKPLAEVMGGAFARAGIILTESLSGKGMQMLIASLSEHLPRIITNLSSAFGKFLNGVGATFAAIMPFVLRFSDYLSRVAGDFARWATSASGQNSITDFVNRALDSLKSLWNFIKAVGGLISALLFNPRGQKAGDNIFDRMAGSLRDFTNYISKENRLEDWFKKGEKFAKLLGKAIKGIGKVIKDLDNSETIDVLMAIYKAGKWAHEQWIKIPGDFTALINPLERLMTPLTGLINGFKELAGWMNATSNYTAPNYGNVTDGSGLIAPVSPGMGMQGASGAAGTGGGGSQSFGSGSASDLANLINSGNAALNATFESAGGYMPDPTKGPKFTHFEGGPMDDWKNPYIAFANALIAAGPTLADEIRAAAKEARATIRAALADVTEMFSDLLTDWNKSFTDGVMDAAKSTDFSAIASSFQSILDSAAEAFNTASATAVDTGAAGIAAATATRDQMVASAEAAVQAAAQRLAGATTKKEAKAALADLKAADDALNLARQKGAQLIEEARKAADKMLAETKASQARLDAAGAILAGQAVLTWGNVNALVAGAAAENATLADYAEARRQVAEKLADATQQLTAAIALRDNYAIQVADSIRQFGSLLTAQAKVIDGVEQALNANDIVENLQDRLAKVKVFQENLRQLLALGLSQSAYKQIVDAGVETGGAYAQALLNGGQGAISEVNSLTDQFDKVATDLGLAAASEMYQAGVDAAQGLVDGLLSLSAQLDSAAAALGAAIAAAIKRELGIASPSKVGYALMRDDFGDGLVGGLDAAHSKVGSASARLAGAIQVSPEVAAYATQQRAAGNTAPDGEGVSGNSDTPKYLWTGNIVTPTEDPHAVSVEVMNELTGRLT